MTPANIIAMAALKGLDVIALTDHNSCKNVPAAMHHAKQYGLTVIPGMELTTEEEIHVICLFPSLEAAMDFDDLIYKEKLLPVRNKEEVFGKQQILNEEDEVVGTVDNLLINATSIAFDDVFPLVQKYGAVAYPAHLDKSSTSLISNLGFIPPESVFTCAEYRDFKNLHRLCAEFPYLKDCKPLCSSDAHYLKDIHEPEYQIYARSKDITDVIDSLR